MSLFGDSRFQYRETFFVLFDQRCRPSATEIKNLFAGLGGKYEVVDIQSTDDRLETLSVHVPQDFSAMDIVYVEGDEVSEQVSEIKEEFRTMTLSGDDVKKLSQIQQCDARFDIFHFEQIVDVTGEEDFLDPGGLLIVLEKLATACKGVAFDPQSQALL